MLLAIAGKTYIHRQSNATIRVPLVLSLCDTTTSLQ